MESIVILDFGGQTTQLIGRRIRDLGVYSEIVPGDCDLKTVLHSGVKGLILSGSPHAAWQEDSPRPDPEIFNCGLPVLAICYGFHQLTIIDGGRVAPLPHREYGRSRVHILESDPLLEGIENDFLSWMSHGDSIELPGPSYTVIAESENGIPAVAVHRHLPLRGVQFHPEADHCEHGALILENFACGICKAARNWTLDSYLDDVVDQTRRQVGDKAVLLLISGGVDSTVTAALLLKTLPRKNVWLMYVDTGLMRLGESQEVAASLEELGAENLLMIDAAQRFFEALDGVENPEEKRRIIGDTFVKVQREETDRHLPDDYLLAQGTLYTDLIESGAGVGRRAQVIKSHHNVGTPLIKAKRAAGELLEPLAGLYKDEVRRLGIRLGVSDQVVARHPFPGPGLAVRILSAVTPKKVDVLRQADAIYIRELRKRGLYDRIWQAFAVLLPVRSVGITGDVRGYTYVCALRAVVSRDGMSADVFDFPMKDLLEISAKITNQIEDIGRVVYDVSSKPPATIEWE